MGGVEHRSTGQHGAGRVARVMSDFGHPSIPDLPERVTERSAVGVATVRLADLHRRAGADALRRPRRMQAHLLALITTGRSSFTVDFTAYPCRPGGLLWVQPGQVMTLPKPGLGATLVLFESAFPRIPEGQRGRWNPLGSYWQPAGEDEEAIVDGVTQLETDCARAAAGEAIPIELLRYQLTTLLMRIVRLRPEDATGQLGEVTEVFDRFRDEVEAHFAASHQVEEYAHTLGCSVRTLTRASLAATGRTAKQFVDDRVALEAKRLLAHTDLAVVEIAKELGFVEPTNFGRFFARTTGVSPGRFRDTAR
jgi:AraC-like DNA-binding protein